MVDGGENKNIIQITQEKTLDKKQERWDKELHNLNLYHGTSTVNAEKILREGIKANDKPYNEEDRILMEVELSVRGINVGSYANDKEKMFYVEGSDLSDNGQIFDGPVGYAIAGPEMIRAYLLPIASQLEKIMKEEIDLGRGDQQGFEEILRIKKGLLKSIYEHRPALIKIKRDSDSFKKIIDERVPNSLKGALDNFSDFEKVVQEIVTEYGVSEIEAVDYAISMIKRNLFNISITETINPGDLEIISGEDFKNLNMKTKTIEQIREKCFMNEEKQVSGILEALYNVVYFNAYNLAEIRELAAFYEISIDDADRYYQRAVELQKQNKNVVK